MTLVIPGARYESGLGYGVTGGEAIDIEQTLKRKEIGYVMKYHICLCRTHNYSQTNFK